MDLIILGVHNIMLKFLIIEFSRYNIDVKLIIWYLFTIILIINTFEYIIWDLTSS